MAPIQPTVDTGGYATILSANQFDFDIARHNFASSKSLIDISISFSAWNETLYTAVWAPEPSGADTNVVGNITADQLQQWVQACNTAGRRIVTISATGSGSDARFAGIAVPEPGTKSMVNTILIDLTDQNLQKWLDNMSSAGSNMCMITSYGTPESGKYATLFHFSPDSTPVSFVWTNSDADMNNYESAYTAMKTYSPYWVTVSGAWRSVCYAPRDVGVWEIQTAVPQSSVSTYLQKLEGLKLHPIRLQQVDATHYDVIAAQSWPPVARLWSVNGPDPSPNVENALVNGIDSLFRSFMQANNIRHAQVAIGKTDGIPGAQNTNIYVSRAYTWSQPGSYVANPTDKFLLASVSKAFSIQATNMIIQSVGLAPGKTAPTLDSKIFDLLGYTGKTPHDNRIFDITVGNCVNMYSGFDDSADGTYDPTYHSREVAQWVKDFKKNPTLTPVVITDMIDYKFYAGQLDHDPGQVYGYANVNNVILAHLVEVFSGMSYIDYLTQHVLPPCSIAGDVVYWPTAASAHANDSIVQESSRTGLSAIDPNSSAQVPAIYGGDGISKECTMGSASLACSATTLVKFIGRCAAWGIGGRVAGSGREGSMDGASSLINSSSNENALDLSIVLNTRDFGAGVDLEVFYTRVKALVDAAVIQNGP